MSRWSYSDEELDQYFQDPDRRRARKERPGRGLRGFWYRRFDDPRKAEAGFILSLVTAGILLITLVLGVYMLALADDLPPTRQLENPEFQLATIAYTADGAELQRYAFQNRS